MRILFLRQRFKDKNLSNNLFAKKFIVDCVFSQKEFFEKFYLFNYELVMIEASKASFNCSQIAEEVKVEKPHLPIIFLLKNYETEVFKDLLTSHANSIFYQSNFTKNQPTKNNIKLGNLNFDFAQNNFLLRGRVLDLPRREFLLLAKLFLHHQQFLSRDDISKFLLKDCYVASSNLIDVYIYRLRKVLRQVSPDLHIRRHHYLGYKIAHCNQA